ncbi:hypothetical protein GCM10028792_11790 [Salinisphaera aquimarina]
MIAQHYDRAFAEIPDPTQNARGIGPAVDEIAEEPEPGGGVACIQQLQKRVEGIGGAMNIAD